MCSGHAPLSTWKTSHSRACLLFVLWAASTLETRKIEMRLVSALIPYQKNARTHSDSQVDQIAASIEQFGWTNPILIDADNVIIAGHARSLAAKKLRMTEVPVIVLGHLTEAQRRAL